MKMIPEELKQLIEEFNASQDRSAETKKNNRAVITRLFLATKKIPHEITTADLIEFFTRLREEGLKSSSIQTYANILASFFKYLWLRGQITTTRLNELREVLRRQKARGQRLPDHLEDHEIRILMKTLDRKFKGRPEWVIIPLLLSTGLRVKELLNLKVEDVDFEKMQLKVFGKGSKEDTVRVLQAIPNVDVMDRLDLWIKKKNLKKGDRLFPYSDRTIRNMVKRVARAAGLDENVHPHTLRHTLAVQLVERDVPVEIIRRQLRHSKITTTQIYMKLKDKMYSKLTEGLTKIE